MRKPEEGTFDWAVDQMDRGNKVRRKSLSLWVYVVIDQQIIRVG